MTVPKKTQPSVLRPIPQNHIPKKQKIMPTSSHAGIRKVPKLTKQESAKQAELAKHEKELSLKRLEYSDLESHKMSLITQMQKEEFKLHILTREHIELKEKLSTIEHDIRSTLEDRTTSSAEFIEMYNLEKQRLSLQHKARLNEFKEAATEQAQKIIDEEINSAATEKELIKESISKAAEHLKRLASDFEHQLVKLQEDHDKNLVSLNMDDNVTTLKQTIQLIVKNNGEKSLQLVDLRTKLDELNRENEKFSRIKIQLQTKHNDKNNEIETLYATISSKKRQIEQIEKSTNTAEIESFKAKTKEINAYLSAQENGRRILHNKLQELKGNIRVFCRIRPSVEPLSQIKLSQDDLNDESNQEITLTRETSPFGGSATGEYNFQFDRIFLTEDKNSAIFEEISQLIQSSLDGYNVCVFAYGQTGSGKTFTMSEATTGMIPMSIEKIFNDIESLEHWKYKICGQFVEIYNENIVDLLEPSLEAKYEIKHDDINGKTSITNIKTIQITSKEMAKDLLTTASRNRSTAFTKANERSSRSHSIFILSIDGVNSKTGEHTSGTLNLIDLAGSERLSSSQTIGDRLRETQAINKSLSSLGDVIYSLGQQQQSHIPYRNSKLTFLLKHSLGGDSKTLMFVNISPVLKNFNETVNSLRFASKVNSTKLKRASKS